MLSQNYPIKLTLTIVALFMLACNFNSHVSPPVAKIIPKADTLFNDIRIDNYFWMREKSNPEVIDYLKAENNYTKAMMKHTEDFQEKLYKEIVGRIKETDLSAPVKKGNYYYYKRTEEGKQYSIYCRKKGSLGADEEILLDQNLLAQGHSYFSMGVFKISPDQQLLAYSTDTTGAETYTVYIKDLKTGKLFDDEIQNTYYSVEWANDNKTLFYNTLDEAKRPYKLYRHILGINAGDDKLIYHETDEKYFLKISRTKSAGYLLMTLKSNVSSEVHYLNADRPDDKFQIIQPRRSGIEYYADHHGKDFYIYTNDNAVNFKLVKVPTNTPAKKYWREVIPHRKNVKIDNVDLFKNHLVVYERENGLEQIRIENLKTNAIHYIDFPEPVYTVYGEDNLEFNTGMLRFTYMSLVTPKSIFDYNMESKERELKKQEEVLGGYDPDKYTSERIYAKADDGAMVPISLVYKKDMVKDGGNPLLLRGYGSYGVSSDPYFSSIRFSLIDRGFIYAIAHIRGGGEMGREWYEQGKLLNKKNTFTDFITCAQHLINEKYTNSDRLVISGGSAGGLLMGAALNIRPDLFKAAVAQVPFVDVVSTMLDASIPLTVIEYDEWGNPNEKEFYKYIKSYSPYDNVEAKAYPDILIITGLNDPRVQYWEPAKWTAKLRALKTDDNLLLLKTNMGAGHGGASGRYDMYKEIVFEYAFMLDRLGIYR